MIKTIVLFSALLAVGQVSAQECLREKILASTPTDNFIIYPEGAKLEGTVIHKHTGLMWSRCSYGQFGFDCGEGELVPLLWKDALQVADNLELGGFSDWRIPNEKELASLVDVQCIQPSINLDVFPNTPSRSEHPLGIYPHYTTSFGAKLDLYEEDVSKYMVINFQNGNSWFADKDRHRNLVRFVRGGYTEGKKE